jgi:N6-adenosine-specific RNA methylase IME4
MVDIVRRWRFDWRTMGTWTKNKAGTGQWPRGGTEHYVIASRCKPVHTLNAVTTWLGDRVIDVVPGADGHSRKPAELHDVIEQHCPGPYLEMFARAPRNERWHLWGAETDKFAEHAA